MERAIPGSLDGELASLSDAEIEQKISELQVHIEAEIKSLSLKQLQAHVDELTREGPNEFTRQYVDELWERWRKLREGASEARNPSADYPL